MARKQNNSSQFLKTDAAAVAGIDVSQVTISFRINVEASGANTDFLQLIDDSATAFRIRLRYGNGSSGKFRITFEADWSTTNGTWYDGADTDYGIGSGWHTFLVTYDRGSTSNDPVYYLDSTTTRTPTESSTPAGTVNTGQDTVELFRNGFTGASRIISLADVAIWDRILTSSEIGTVIKHAPIFVPRNLQFYSPLIRGVGERIQGADFNNGSGTTVFDHPSVIRPAGSVSVPVAAAAGGTILPQVTSAYYRINA